MTLRWYAGSWYTSQADCYITPVKAYPSERISEQPSFTDQSQP